MLFLILRPAFTTPLRLITFERLWYTSVRSKVDIALVVVNCICSMKLKSKCDTASDIRGPFIIRPTGITGQLKFCLTIKSPNRIGTSATTSFIILYGHCEKKQAIVSPIKTCMRRSQRLCLCNSIRFNMFSFCVSAYGMCIAIIVSALNVHFLSYVDMDNLISKTTGSLNALHPFLRLRNDLSPSV